VPEIGTAAKYRPEAKTRASANERETGRARVSERQYIAVTRSELNIEWRVMFFPLSSGRIMLMSNPNLAMLPHVSDP